MYRTQDGCGLEEENARLKRLFADTMLDNAGLKDLLSKNDNARREAGSCRASPDGAGDERATGVCCRRGGSHEHAVSLVPGEADTGAETEGGSETPE